CGELKGFGGRGKFRIFKVVGNEDGYLLLMLPPLSGCGELKGFGGRGKFRIFKVVGNEDGYLLLMLPP
ncbi:hypothetical protein C0U44_32570, partial [Klebsiella pneumoniae]